MVENADFSFGIALWKPERDIIIRVEEQSVAEAETPPALSVQSVRALESDALVTAGASQCVVISGGSDYALYAQILIPEGQASGSGGLSALFFDSEDCSGQASGGLMSQLVTEPGQWQVVGVTGEVPGSARSASIRLLTVKPFRQAAVEVLFDDILVRSE